MKKYKQYLFNLNVNTNINQKCIVSYPWHYEIYILGLFACVNY